MVSCITLGRDVEGLNIESDHPADAAGMAAVGSVDMVRTLKSGEKA
jgi:hypothetical protein